MADILTLHGTSPQPGGLPPLPPATGGTALAEAPPRVRRRHTVERVALTRPRTLAIRHVSGHRLVALLEIVSPGNKDRGDHLDAFTVKAASALEHGIHLLVVEVFPPGPRDPQGIHEVILRVLEPTGARYELPANEPLTLASYVASTKIEVYLEHVARGHPLPEMPLFLLPDRYIPVPLEATYMAAYRGTPEYWRRVLEGSGLYSGSSPAASFSDTAHLAPGRRGAGLAASRV